MTKSFIDVLNAFKRLKSGNLIAILILGIIISLISCSKDDEATPAPEVDFAPVNYVFFVDNPFKIVSTGTGTYEYGVSFKVKKNGTISQLGCKMPDSSTYRVALWDSASKKVLSEKSFISKAATLTFQSISPVTLKKDTTYLVTILSQNTPWYYFTRTNSSKIPYPLNKGNVNVTGYYWTSSTAGAAPKFPTNKDLTYAAGLPDFVFTAN
jgi:hypothetical protein